MAVGAKKKIVFLGMLTKIPVAGAVWGAVHYVVGLNRLGYDAYYVEAHARMPSMFMTSKTDDATDKAAAFIADFMNRFDLGDHWAFHALHRPDHPCYGMSEERLLELYRTADLIINYHGGTVPRPEHLETGRLLLLETDPVDLQIELYKREKKALNFVAQHLNTIFTWGLNYNHPDCRLPITDDVRYVPSPPVVVPDLWRPERPTGGEAFTTVGNWKQLWREIRFQGETYSWSKHHEFMKVIDLPARRPDQPFELALGSYDAADQRMLESHGWRVRNAMDFSGEMDPYRRYLQESRGEFTVAKDQNVRLRSGWFSERSAQYLAAGRPVITQDTGFGNYLPTGEGLFAFSNPDDVLKAVDAVNSDYPRHCKAAAAIARAYLSYDVVLPRMMETLGV